MTHKQVREINERRADRADAVDSRQHVKPRVGKTGKAELRAELLAAVDVEAIERALDAE